MKLDFWDIFMMQTMMSIRDYYREKDRFKENEAKQTEKFAAETGDCAQNMLNVVIDLSNKTGYRFTEELSKGLKETVSYAFLKVLRSQGRPISRVQSRLVHIYFDTFKPSYTENDFFIAARSSGGADLEIEKYAGLRKENMGIFWKEFFNMMGDRTENEAYLEALLRNYMGLITGFACVNGGSQIEAERVCKDICDSVRDCLDYARQEGMVTNSNQALSKHFSRLKEINEIFHQATIKDDLSLDQAFDLFIFGVLKKMFLESTTNVSKMASYFDEVEKECEGGLESGVGSFYTLLMEWKNDPSRLEICDSLVSLEGEPPNFLVLLLTVGSVNDLDHLVTEFTSEFMDFLVGVEDMLTREFYDFNTHDFASSYGRKVLEKIIELVS